MKLVNQMLRWTLALSLVASLMVNPAEARRWGSRGSSGSWGSCGSSGSHGSCGSSGSWGSCGSSGGSYGSHGSCGSHGSSGSHGSCGSSGVVYHVPVIHHHPPVHCPDGKCHLSVSHPVPANSARLTITVPENAIVSLMGQQMKSTGKVRVFDVPKLETGKTYDYPIEVSVTHAGRTLSAKANQPIRTNDQVELVCNLGNQSLTFAQKEGQSNILALQVQPQAQLAQK